MSNLRKAAAVLAGAASLFLAFSVLSPMRTTGGSTLERLERETPSGMKAVVVLLDGWSAKTAGTTSLEWSDPFTDEQSWQSLDLVPMTGKDLQRLGSETPDVVNTVTARLVDANPKLRCDQHGCRAGSSRYGYDSVADLSASGELAQAYSGWGITNALYGAVLRVPSSTTSVVVRPAGSKAELTLLLNGADYGPVRDLAAGFHRDRFLLAYALGRTFQPHARWIEGGPGYNVAIVSAATEGRIDLTKPPLLSGLADTATDVSSMGEDRLTYISSPATGCSFAVLCAPATVRAVNYDRQYAQDFRMCTAADASSNSAIVVIRRGVLTVDLPHPVHQAGMPGSVKQENFAGTAIPANRALTGGRIRMLINSAEIWDGGSIAGILSGNLDADREDPELLSGGEPYSLDEVSKLWRGNWLPCPSGGGSGTSPLAT